MRYIFKFLFLFFLFIVFCFAKLFAYQGAHIECGKQVYDLGAIFQKQRVSFQFLLKNHRDKTSGDTEYICKLPLHGFKRDLTGPIPPEQSIVLKGIMDTSFYSGEIERKIELSTNDQDNPKIQLTIKGVIIDTVDFYPDILQFSGFLHNKGMLNKQVILTLRKNKNFLIDSVCIPVQYKDAVFVCTITRIMIKGKLLIFI